MRGPSRTGEKLCTGPSWDLATPLSRGKGAARRQPGGVRSPMSAAACAISDRQVFVLGMTEV